MGKSLNALQIFEKTTGTVINSMKLIRSNYNCYFRNFILNLDDQFNSVDKDLSTSALLIFWTR